MHPFEQTVSVVGPIVGGVVALTLFFKLVGWVERRSSAKPGRVSVRGVLDRDTPVTIHVVGGRKFEAVRVVGYTRAEVGKGAIPWELGGMVILEHPDGRQTVVRAKDVRMIEVGPAV